jgi:hypothetical protein
MSGGYFSYSDSHLKSEIFGWSDRPTNVFEDKEISELVWDVLDLVHAFDWYKSGDTGEASYLKAKRTLKDKWLKHDSDRVKRIVDETLAECKDELYKTYGLKEGEHDRCSE